MRSRLSLAVRRQKKLLLLFMLTIVGPAVALAVFGFRALDADRYRVQELLHREQEEAFRSARATLLSEIELIGASLGSLSEELRGMTNWEAACRAAYDHVRKRTTRGRVVVLGSGGEFFFASDGFGVPARPQVEPSDGEWRRYHEAQKLESDDASRSAAASSFVEIAAATKDRRLRMTALNAAGRSFLKLARYSEAAAAYRSLLDDWLPPIDSEIVALPLIAGLKLGTSLEKQGADALPALVDVYREVVERRWIVSVPTVEYYSEQYEGAIDAHCQGQGSQPLCREYRELRERKPARLARLRELEGTRVFLAAALRPEASAASGGRRVIPIQGCACFAIALHAAAEGRGDLRGPEFAVATIVEETALLERLVAARAKQTRSVQLRVARPDRTVLYASSPADAAAIFLEQDLGDGLPPWKLTLFHDPRDAVGVLAAQRRFHVALTVASVALLFAGAFLTIRTLNHEMNVLRMKSDLVSVVSHEFKNPITSIRTLMERLQAGYVTDASRRQQYFDVVCGELQRLTRLVNNFLAFSSMETGGKQYHRIETDLRVLLAEVLTPFEARATQQGFTLETEIESGLPSVEVDRDSLSQAVLNLLDNAVKYSSESRTIRISARRNTRSVELSVTDWGRGVQPAEAARIFEKSYRSAATAREGVPGIGLGLAIVKHVMTAHGGDVTVQSRPGQGTTFTLHIPLPMGAAEESCVHSPERDEAPV